MIDALVDGGSQWESNASATPAAANLHIPENAQTDKLAKRGRKRYSGVQRREWQTIEEWRHEQRAYPAQTTPVDWARVAAEERFYSAPDLRDVFAPTQSSTGLDFDGNIHELAAGFIEARAVKIPYGSIAPSVSIARLDQKWLRSNSGRESDEHRDLKLLGICWLRSIGARRAAAEMDCKYGRADAYSSDLDFAVECGNTAIGRVFAVKSGSPVGVLVLPFASGSSDHYNATLFTQGHYQGGSNA